jgi:hypothetical protein
VTSTPRPLRRPLRSRLAVTALGLVSAGLVTGCGSDAGKAHASNGSDMTRYIQTWGTDYAHTTCSQWGSRMTGRQRWTAAFELLRDSRNGDAAIAAMPADSLVGRFESDIDRRCGGASSTDIADVASAAYLAHRSDYRS